MGILCSICTLTYNEICLYIILYYILLHILLHYIIFQAEAEAALKRDREPLDGRPMFISRCEPDKLSRQSGFKYRTTLEKNKLFVKGELVNFIVYSLTDMEFFCHIPLVSTSASHNS